MRLGRKGPGETVQLTAPAGGGKQWLRVGRPAGAPNATTGAIPASQPGPMLVVVASPIRVSADTAGWIVVDATGQRNAIDGNDPIEIGVLKGTTARIAIDGNTFPGVARLVARTVETSGEREASPIAPRSFDIVNVCPIEQYIPGVLARELYPTWKDETFHAQAVAARTFACVEAAQWADRRHFDVHASQASQAYVGETNHQPSLRATARTRGEFLLYRGLMVPAYYSSTCGGVSANAVDAISDDPINDIAPIQARPPKSCCAWAPLYRWTSEQSTADAARRIAAWSIDRPQFRVPSVSSVAGVEATQLNEFGRPVRYRVTDGRGGAFEIPAEHLRVALNFASGSLTTPKNPVRSGNFTASTRGTLLRVEGRGYGHSVGMCQYGAEGMAREGAQWRTILEAYYPGAIALATYA